MNESLLDWADFEQWFCETDYGKESGDRMKKIVELLKKYGAKYSKDFTTDRLKKQKRG
jgi:hypothetical protein